MSLAIAASMTAQGSVIVAVDANEQWTELSLSAVSRDGLPSKKSRAAFAGDLTNWGAADFETYCSGLGIELPVWVRPQHQVFTGVLGDGTTVFVPALAWMRAFFWPGKDVLPATFTSQNVDQFAYVDYSHDVAVVKVMEGPNNFRGLDTREGNDRHLKWLHGSWSARDSCQSVELHALKGWLGLKLPQGEFDLTLVGHRAGSAFFATGVEVNSVKVFAADNVSGQDEMFYLHRSPLTDSMRRAQSLEPTVTEDEWQALEPTVSLSGFDLGRDVLVLMLKRLTNGYWDRADDGVVCEAGKVLRSWSTSSTLGDVVDRLTAIRRGSFPTDPVRLATLRAGAPVTERPRELGEKVASVFLDCEFVDRGDEVLLLSIGLAADGSEFYGERTLSSLGPKFSAGKFIDSEVLPQLGRDIGLQGGPCDIAKGLVSWLNGLSVDRVDVHYDFNLDYTLFEHLLALVPGQLNRRLEPVHIGYLLDDPNGASAAVMSWAMSKASRGIQRHHSLADAIALKARFDAVHSSQGAEL